MTNSYSARQLEDRSVRRRWAAKAGPRALGVGLSFTLLSGIAYADENPAPPPPEMAPATNSPASIAPLPPTAAPPMQPVKAQPVIAVNAEEKSATSAESSESASHISTDHELVVGKLGIGFIGQYAVPLPKAVSIGRGDEAGMIPNDKLDLQLIQIPTVGIRKWLSNRRAFEAGIGVSFSGGSQTANYGSVSSSVDKATVFAMSVHGGMPILVADTRHMAFMVIPEATLSFAGSDIAVEFEENAPPNARVRGFAFNAGIRAGAEVHFGFMGLPRLALQAGVGLYVQAQWANATVSNQSLSQTDLSIGFGSDGNPWQIFSAAANLSARYYF